MPARQAHRGRAVVVERGRAGELVLRRLDVEAGRGRRHVEDGLGDRDPRALARFEEPAVGGQRAGRAQRVIRKVDRERRSTIGRCRDLLERRCIDGSIATRYPRVDEARQGDQGEGGGKRRARDQIAGSHGGATLRPNGPLSSARTAPSARFDRSRDQCWTTMTVLVPGWAAPLVSPCPCRHTVDPELAALGIRRPAGSPRRGDRRRARSPAEPVGPPRGRRRVGRPFAPIVRRLRWPKLRSPRSPIHTARWVPSASHATAQSTPAALAIVGRQAGRQSRGSGRARRRGRGARRGRRRPTPTARRMRRRSGSSVAFGVVVGEASADEPALAVALGDASGSEGEAGATDGFDARRGRGRGDDRPAADHEPARGRHPSAALRVAGDGALPVHDELAGRIDGGPPGGRRDRGPGERRRVDDERDDAELRVSRQGRHPRPRAADGDAPSGFGTAWARLPMSWLPTHPANTDWPSVVTGVASPSPACHR